MALPVASGRITQVFGRTSEPLDSGGMNKGLDVSVPVGTDIFAATDGVVVSAGDSGDGWGTSVKVRDKEGYVHNYGHLSGVNVSKGDRVREGQVIAKSGNTGASTGPHLSYDVKDPANGRYVNPSRWLGFDAAGDNRKGHPNIGKDVGALAGSPTPPSLRPGGSPEDSSGGDVQGRALTSEGIYSGARIPVDSGDDRFGEGGSLPADYDPSGDFNTDASAYWRLSNYFRNEVRKFQQGYDGVLMVDEGSGLVYAPGANIDNPGEGFEVINTNSGPVAVHSQATEALQRAEAYEANLDRLFAARQAGLMDNGQDAAAAYLASEKEKAAEATRKYEDYVRRIGDLADIESIPQQRQQTLAATIQAINQVNKERGRFDSGMLASGGPEFTDVTPFADAVRETIPEEAPERYDIDPSALEPQPTGGFQSNAAEDILRSWQERTGNYSLGPGTGSGPPDEIRPTQPTPPSLRPGGAGSANRRPVSRDRTFSSVNPDYTMAEFMNQIYNQPNYRQGIQPQNPPPSNPDYTRDEYNELLFGGILPNMGSGLGPAPQLGPRR